MHLSLANRNTILTMNTIDLIKICGASAVVGAASVVIVLIIWAAIRDARAERERRDHYVGGSTGRWRG